MADRPPEEGRVNGHDEPATKVEAAQRARYPFLEHFGARAVFAGRVAQAQREPTGYELRLGLRIGPTVGKSIDVTIPRGAPGAFLVGMLREMANAIERHVQDCASASNDAREAIPEAMLATMPAPGEACALCGTTDPQRFASCKRSGCPCARARDAAPIAIPGKLAQAVNDAYTPPKGEPAPIPGERPPVVDARGHAYDPQCGCAACACERAELDARGHRKPH